MKPIKIEWTEGFSTPTRHATDVTLTKTDDGGLCRNAARAKVITGTEQSS